MSLYSSHEGSTISSCILEVPCIPGLTQGLQGLLNSISLPLPAQGSAYPMCQLPQVSDFCGPFSYSVGEIM